MSTTRFNYFTKALLLALAVMAAESSHASPACEAFFNPESLSSLFSHVPDRPNSEFLKALIAGKTVAPKDHLDHPVEQMDKALEYLSRANVKVLITDDSGNTTWGTIVDVDLKRSSFKVHGQVLTQKGKLIENLTTPFSVSWPVAWESGRVAGSTNVLNYVTSIRIQPDLPKTVKPNPVVQGSEDQRDFSGLFAHMLDLPQGDFTQALITGKTVAPKDQLSHPVEHMAKGIDYLARANVKVMVTDDSGRTMWGTLVDVDGSSFKIYGRMLDAHGHLIENMTAPFSVSWPEAWESGRVAGSTNVTGYVTSIRIQPEIPKQLKSNPDDQGTELERTGGTLSPNHEKNAFVESIRNGDKIMISNSMSPGTERDLMQALVSVGHAKLFVQIVDSEGNRHTGQITEVKGLRFKLSGLTRTREGSLRDNNEIGFSLSQVERYQSNGKLNKPVSIQRIVKE